MKKSVLPPADRPQPAGQLPPKLQSGLTRQLAGGRTRGLGPVETLLLRHTGTVDGRGGTPKQQPPDGWTSPFIRKELDAYEEYCGRVWGSQQVELHGAHARRDSLVDDILSLNARLEQAQREAEEALPPLPLGRRRGEEALTDDQVQARRSRAAARQAAQRRAATAHLLQERAWKLAQLSQLHSAITEADHAARLVCQRVMHHTRQRIHVYWRAALRVHPDSERMPAAIEPPARSEAERIYLARFERRDATAAGLLALYQARLAHEEVS